MAQECVSIRKKFGKKCFAFPSIAPSLYSGMIASGRFTCGRLIDGNVVADGNRSQETCGQQRGIR